MQPRLTYEFSWGERHSVMTTEMWILSYIHYRSVLANENQHVFMYVKDGHVQTFTPVEELPAAFEAGQMMLKSDFLDHYLQESQVVRNNYEKLYTKVHKLELSTLSNVQLANLLREYQKLFEHVYALFKITQPEYPETAAQRLRELLQQRLPIDQVEAAFITLTTPTEMDMMKQEEIDAYKLSLQPAVTESDIRTYAEQYPWFFFNTYNRQTISDFLQAKFTDLGKVPVTQRQAFIDRARHSLAEQQKKHADWLITLDHDPDITYLSSLFGKLANDRLELKRWWTGGEYLFLPLFEEIVRRLNVSLDDFFMGYRIQEIYQALEEGKLLSSETISQRKRLYACILEGEEFRFLEGEKAQQLYDEYITAPQAVSPDKHQLRGTIANTGVAKGIARIIRVEDLQELMNDMNRFQEGEIIVTTMTQPAVVSLARKAAAIVTNEGGITSHAAILAREFGIPCLVGTKTATGLIQDGDLIEVNGSEGVVKIL